MKNQHICWRCGRNGSADPLDKHHIFGGALRAKSEKYGLYVYLCHHNCHIFGAEAAHQNAAVAETLMKYGQKKVMLEQGWTAAEFMAEFGKNRLDAHELEEIYKKQNEQKKPTGFKLLGDGVDFLGQLGA